MDETKLEFYWNDIPIGSENAVDYDELSGAWNVNYRTVRAILQRLSAYDNGDDFVLIRSGRKRGFYKSNDATEIKSYKHECLNKGKSLFAPLKKIKRVLSADCQQYSFVNNMRLIRERNYLTQANVCKKMQNFDENFDVPMLSKMENGICLPTPMQLVLLSTIYGCNPADLVKTNIFDFV